MNPLPSHLWAAQLRREEVSAARQSWAAGRVRVISCSRGGPEQAAGTRGERKVGCRHLSGFSAWAGTFALGAGTVGDGVLCPGAEQGGVSGEGHAGG